MKELQGVHELPVHYKITAPSRLFCLCHAGLFALKGSFSFPRLLITLTCTHLHMQLKTRYLYLMQSLAVGMRLEKVNSKLLSRSHKILSLIILGLFTLLNSLCIHKPGHPTTKNMFLEVHF